MLIIQCYKKKLDNELTIKNLFVNMYLNHKKRILIDEFIK